MPSAEDKQCKLVNNASPVEKATVIHGLFCINFECIRRKIFILIQRNMNSSHLYLWIFLIIFKILQNLITKRYLALVCLHVHKTGNTAERSNWRTGLERSEATRWACSLSCRFPLYFQYCNLLLPAGEGLYNLISVDDILTEALYNIFSVSLSETSLGWKGVWRETGTTVTVVSDCGTLSLSLSLSL